MDIEIVEIPSRSVKILCDIHGLVHMVPIDKEGRRVSASYMSACELCHPEEQ